jgi:hypothetical protein
MVPINFLPTIQCIVEPERFPMNLEQSCSYKKGPPAERPGDTCIQKLPQTSILFDADIRTLFIEQIIFMIDLRFILQWLSCLLYFRERLDALIGEMLL